MNTHFFFEIGKTLIKLIALTVQDIKVENCHCYKFNKRCFLSELIECVDFSLSGQWIHIYSFEIGKMLIKLIAMTMQDIKVENCQV